MWNEATQEVRDLYEREGHDAFEQILREYDQYSIREFLEMRGFREGAIELYGVMRFREQNMNAAVIEQLREIVGRPFEDMQEIVGGIDLLPRAFYAQMKDYVRFGAEVHAIEQSADGVTVHYKTAGNRFSVTRRLRDLRAPFLGPAEHRGQARLLARQAEGHPRAQLQRLDEDPVPDAAPVLGDGTDGIVGGTTATDLPIRRIVLPVVLRPERGARHAARVLHVGPGRAAVGAMGDEDAVEQALEDVAKIHPRSSTSSRSAHIALLVQRPVRAAARSRCSSPEQETRLQPDITAPEGRIHFAGEHTSLYHAWIQGALESGIRAATEIHTAPMVMEPAKD